MPGGGKIRYYKDRRDLYTKYRTLISTLKMVTLARYRQALPRVNTRDYAMKFTRKAFDIPGEFPHEPVQRQEGEDKILIVPFTTNRGSCGPLNTNMTRYLEKFVDAKSPVLAIGKKGQDAMGKVLAEGYQRAIINDMKQAMSFSFGSYVAEHIKSFEWDRVVLLFTRYISTASQRMSMFSIPKYDKWVEGVKKQAGEYKAEVQGQESEDPNNYQLMNALMEREGDFLRDYYDFNVALLASHATMENELSEYAARIVAVENQLANIEGLLLEANYLYNKTRKELITAELLEIISTMSALGKKGGSVARTTFYE
jgi:F-type H+-transporting ATPase subunit gamma